MVVFRNRPLDAAHYPFVWMAALMMKVREHGRTVNVHALVAVGVNADSVKSSAWTSPPTRAGPDGWRSYAA